MERLYAKTHEWVQFIDENTAVIGITDHAQQELGDIVFVNLPEVGNEIQAGAVIADVESVKAVADVLSPVTGTVCEVNEELADSPEKINEDPYGAWIAKVKNVTDKSGLLSEEEYEEFLAEEE